MLGNLFGYGDPDQEGFGLASALSYSLPMLNVALGNQRLSQAMPQATAGLYSMSKLEQQQREQARAAQRRQTVSDWIANNQDKIPGGMGDYLEAIGPEASASIIGQLLTQQTETPEWRNKIDAETKYYIDLGYSPEIAEGIAWGRYKVITDPYSGYTSLVDIAKQAAVGGGGAPLTGGSGVTGGAPAPVPGGGAAPPPPQSAGAVSPSAGTQPPAQQARDPREVDVTEATGFWDAIVSKANRVTDWLGMGVIDKDIDEATNRINRVRNEVMQIGVSADNRPSVFAMQLADVLDIDAGGIFSRDNDTRQKLAEAETMLKEREAFYQEIINNPQNYRPQERNDARVNLGRVRSVLANVQGMVRASGAIQSIGDDSSIDEDVQFLNPYTP